jgi:hypothetical protein
MSNLGSSVGKTIRGKKLTASSADVVRVAVRSECDQTCIDPSVVLIDHRTLLRLRAARR